MNYQPFAVLRRISPFVASRRQASSFSRQRFSAKAIYSLFPATLYCYCPTRSSTLFDHKENDSRPDDIYDESVIVEKNGLVYPAVNAASGW